MNTDHINYLTISLQLQRSHTPYVEVSLITTRGSAPQDVGAKILVTSQNTPEDGPLWGTIGGGKIEAYAIEQARSLLNKKAAPGLNQNHYRVLNLQREIGMSCGGEVGLFFSTHNPNNWVVALFGAGHVAQAVAALLHPLNCQLIVVDHRQSWLERLQPIEAKIHRAPSAESYAKVLDLIPRHAYLLCLTMGHGTDAPILERALKLDHFSFVGTMGSTKKARRLERELIEAGVPEAHVKEKLVCPLGLKLGGNNPREVAISIVSQILMHRDRPDQSDSPCQ